MTLPALRPKNGLSRIKAALPEIHNPFTRLWYFLQGRRSDIQAFHNAVPPALAFPAREISFKDISFTFAVIALSARVASLGGACSQAQYLAFRAAFPLERGICDKLRTLFAMGCADQTPYTQYVRHITVAFPRRMSLFRALTERLFRIACADGSLSKPHEQMLAKISHMLGLGPADYSAIKARCLSQEKPHDILGVTRRAKASALKQRYRELMLRYHPDRYATENLSADAELLLQLKISEINDAYGRMMKRAA